MAMGKMTAVGQIHCENSVANFECRKIDCHVGLSAAMGLDVDVFGAEQLLGPIDRQLFNRVHILTTPVPSFSRIAFRVFVRKDAALCFHYGAAGEIFRRDQFDIFALAFFLRRDRVENLRIDFAQAPARRVQDGWGRIWTIAHRVCDRICGSAAAPGGRWHCHLTFFYERKHARQGVFDRLCASRVDVASETDRVGHVQPRSRTHFFKLAEQESFVGRIREEHRDRFHMGAGHGENMAGPVDECRRQRLAPQLSNIDAFLRANFDGVSTRGLTTNSVNASRSNLNVLAIPKKTAKKAFCNGTATNVSRTNEKDAFHNLPPPEDCVGTN